MCVWGGGGGGGGGGRGGEVGEGMGGSEKRAGKNSWLQGCYCLNVTVEQVWLHCAGHT